MIDWVQGSLFQSAAAVLSERGRTEDTTPWVGCWRCRVRLTHAEVEMYEADGWRHCERCRQVWGPREEGTK